MEILAGYALFAVFVVVIISIILFNIDMVKRDTRKEERQKARQYAHNLAEREFNRMVRDVEFKVTQKMIISNESDIKW
ncbi:MAG: hypothetical protein J6U54_08020 [Clostridiales bacterium]|nr:hypothetical protein [Clostridiales bacterium]